MKDVKLNAPTAPRSQLADKTGAAVQSAPVSTLARFVLGDIKGSEAAHNFRMDTVAAAVREALKGNSRALTEAHALSTGKAKKARAYAAGFAAVGIPARVQYVGKLDAPHNEEARRQINEQARALEFEFESAFLTVFHAPAEKKASKVAQAEEAASAAMSATDTDTDSAPVSAAPVAVADLLVSEIMEGAVKAIAGGLAVADEVEAIRAALVQYDTARATLKALESAPAELLAA